MSSRLVSISTAIAAALAAHTWTTAGLTVTTERIWAPDYDKDVRFKTAGIAVLTVLPGGLVTEQPDSDSWRREPTIGLLIQTRCETEAHNDRAAEFAEEVLDFLENAIDLHAADAAIEELTVPQFVDHELLRTSRLWRTPIVIRLEADVLGRTR